MYIYHLLEYGPEKVTYPLIFMFISKIEMIQSQ